MRKAGSLVKYIRVFKNWRVGALARYLKGRLGDEATLLLRDGRRLIFRPASDHVALGEVFVMESYAAVRLMQAVNRVWDIGANIGCFTIWAAEHFREATFESFEPCTPTYSLLARNRAANPWIKWKVFPFGFGSRDERCEARVANAMFGEAGRFAQTGERHEFELRGIDAYWRSAGYPDIDVLKMDCEGSEYDIMAGMSGEMLQHIRFMIIEAHVVSGKTPAQLLQTLRAHSFIVQGHETCQGLITAIRPEQRIY